MAHTVLVRLLRGALEHIGLSREEAAVFSAHSMRSGGATTTADHGHREDIQYLAGVKDVNWLVCNNRRMYLTEHLRVLQAIGL
jgi:hypothetical protein